MDSVGEGEGGKIWENGIEIFFFDGVFVWFWYQGDGGFIECL